MEYQKYLEAVKKVHAIKPKDNYMVIELYYDNKLILPYKDGLAFMASLVNAEMYETPYDKPHKIGSFNRDAVKNTIMSGEDYIKHKIAALLNVTLDQLKDIELLETQ